MAEAIGLSLGALSLIVQSYSVVLEAYDVYINFRDFSRTNRDIRMCLLIEKHRLELWASLMGLDNAGANLDLSSENVVHWKLFELIFNSMLSALQDSHEKMEKAGRKIHLNTQDGTDSAREIIESLSLSSSEKPKLNRNGLLEKLRFILRDQAKMYSLIKRLCYLNDSLEKMTSQLEREALRRKLRTHFATLDLIEISNVGKAADMLHHQDLKHLVTTKLLVGQIESREIGKEALDELEVDVETSLRLDLDSLDIQEAQYATDQPRTMAMYKDEHIIIDWRASDDDTWRVKNASKFRERTENLTRVLNRDLKALNLSILHCIGYLNQSKNVTGYAFRLPQHAQKARKHYTLFDLVSKERDPRDIPDLGERFELAKALVRTVYEIQSINWLHKSISSKNIVFWSRGDDNSNPDYTLPYLLGFDISRPNESFEESEKPILRGDEDHYYHPDYRGRLFEQPTPERCAMAFKPSYDVYSLGVVLYEIGIWHNLSRISKRHSSNSSWQMPSWDPNLVQKLLGERQIRELKRHTGRRYTEVVVSCLDRSLDIFWEDPSIYNNHSIQLQRYLRHVQKTIVEPLAVCCA